MAHEILSVKLYELEIFIFKQRAAYEISACVVGSEICIRAGQKR